jgi:hypothetical protein
VRASACFHLLTKINVRGLQAPLGCGMDEDRAAVARRKIELNREMLAKGVDGGTGMIYLVEITKLELLLEEINNADKKGQRLGGKI